jgi:hypothetical protein
MLKKAVEWGVIDTMPCTVRLLKVSSGAVDFYDFDEYERLVEGARSVGSTPYVVVLLVMQNVPARSIQELAGPRSLDDAAVHAPQFGGDRRGDPTPESPVNAGRFRRHFGDGGIPKS